jgi:hypothetical protein
MNEFKEIKTKIQELLLLREKEVNQLVNSFEEKKRYIESIIHHVNDVITKINVYCIDNAVDSLRRDIYLLKIVSIILEGLEIRDNERY